MKLILAAGEEEPLPDRGDFRRARMNAGYSLARTGSIVGVGKQRVHGFESGLNPYPKWDVNGAYKKLLEKPFKGPCYVRMK